MCYASHTYERSIQMKRLIGALPLFCLIGALGSAAAAAPTYAIVGEPGEQRLVAKTAGGLLKSGPLDDYLALIEAQRDFDGDGVTDALFLTNCGGNGCPESGYSIATVRAGKLLLIRVGFAGDARVVRKGSSWLIELESTEGWKQFAFANGKVVPYATKKRTVLHATVEVKGGAAYSKGPPRSFEVDVDLDGKPETIRCTIWERWGSLLCTLPTPRGPQTLSTGCDRFGALATTSGGRREFVCNADMVVRFDGKRWNEPRPTR